MELAFFAATPFQVFNCINIYKNVYENEQADLFILVLAADLSDIQKRLEKHRIFRNVYVMDGINRIPGKRGVLKDFLLTDQKNKRMLTEHRYDAMYTTFIGDRNNLYYSLLLRQNKEMKVFFYDEGIGIYTKGYYESTGLMRRFYKLTGKRYINDFFDAVYVYAPGSVMAELDAPLQKIPCIDKADIPFKDMLNAVFDCSGELMGEYEEHRVFYMDQDFSRYLSSEEAKKRYRFSHIEFLDKMAEIVGQGNILVKKHPIRRDTGYEEKGYHTAKQMDVPWEIVQLNGSFSDKILVGINSTALLTSKMIYDEEPWVIVLGRMIMKEGLSEYVWDEETEKLFGSVRSMYRNKDKFMIPKSYDEFAECIEKAGGRSAGKY